MRKIRKSSKLANVCYDIRGPVLAKARQLENEGERILNLNIGNPTPFGFETPMEIVQDVMRGLPEAQGYTDSKGIFSARKAIMQHCQEQHIEGVTLEDIYIGNGVSELIGMATLALLDAGDEVLIPSPDYPLWTATVNIAGGKPVHYRCDEATGWLPDLDHIESLINNKTKVIVVINPNNPTGAVYPETTLRALLRIAEKHDLLVFADEIYSDIVYDDLPCPPIASLTNEQLILTFNGLSKNYRAPGFRTGWVIASGPKEHAADFIEGLNILSSMRLCANVPAQHGIQTALGGYQSVKELVEPGGLWYQQRQVAWEKINQIPGLSCTKPKGALYLFPRIDPQAIPIFDDEQMALDLLLQEKVLIVQGSSFNLPTQDHFRIVFLPREPGLGDAIDKIGHFFSSYQQSTLKTLSA